MSLIDAILASAMVGGSSGGTVSASKTGEIVTVTDSSGHVTTLEGMS